MNYFEKQSRKFDSAQRQRPGLGFIYGVIKKYSDDEAGYQAALITYYGFLSLFPFLIMVTTVLKLIFPGHSHLRSQILAHLSQYVPILGNELQRNVQSVPRAGFGLVITVLITLYGARGVATAIRRALNHLWLQPRREGLGFPASAINNFQTIIIGGLGLVLASLFSTFAASLGHTAVARILSSFVSLVILLVVLLSIFWLATNRKVPAPSLLLSAIIAAVGLQLLQSLGGYLITHELKHLDSLYGAFALVLGLIFWIYLQTQIVLYAIEIAVVRIFRLWPRGLDSKNLTPADRQAYELYAKRQQFSNQ